MIEDDPYADGCAFCAIISGMEPAQELFRSDAIVAFFPDYPAVLGHTLVVPRSHIPDLHSLDRPTAHALADAILEVAPAIIEATAAGGLNVIQSNGSVAGQSVFHLHVHLVPRTHGDRMPDLWPRDKDWPESELDELRMLTRSLLHPRSASADRPTSA